jgi:pimeloyl-ACP methyl ester carboxylesterase
VQSAVEFVTIEWAGRSVQIEHQWLPSSQPGAPLMVFLHEGLGSLSMWRDFPQRLCAALGCPGLVYSRPGYGQSTARAEGDHWAPDFMHRQAYEVLPALLAALKVDATAQPLRLLGHSDGGSIALLFAARFPDQVERAIVLAPHTMVEALSITSIEQTRQAYLNTDLRARLARHHADPDSAFWGWNRIWLDPAFRQWSIADEVAAIRCPLLAVQGLDDEYGTLEQIRGLARRLPHARLLELPDCGHSPHRDQCDALISAVQSFVH